ARRLRLGGSARVADAQTVVRYRRSPMSDNVQMGGGSPVELPGSDGRSNGLVPEAPNPGQRVLLAGGAGYIGCILAGRLLERGYEVRILDRMWWGDDPLAHIRDRIEVVTADVRAVPAESFEV